MIKLIVITVLLSLPFLFIFAGAALSGIEGAVAGFNDDAEDASLLHEELVERRVIYAAAAIEANADLCEETAAFGIDWAILAAIDLISGDDRVEAHKMADMLRTNVTYKESTVTTRIYRAPPANPYWQEPSAELVLAETDTETVRLVSLVDTYKGIYRFEYEKAEEEIVTERSEDGGVIEKTVESKYFLSGIVHEPEFSRLRAAIALRTGDPEADVLDADVIFAEEYSRMLAQGAVQFYGLDAAVSLAEYEAGLGGTFALYRSDKGYVWPVVGHRSISSPFGVFRNIPSIGLRGVHMGIDIPVPVGTPVVAVTEGVVAKIYVTLGGGRSLRLDAPGGRSFLYVHLNCWADSYVGQQVEAGDIIARSGNTGKWTTGPHLHFEVIINGAHVDPVSYAGW